MATCDNCGKRATVRLHYNGTGLCAECFCAQFEKRVWKANKDFGMLKLGDRVAVAVSGGKDSGAMLYVLEKMRPKIRGLELFPVIVDEGIPGYRGSGIRKAEELCRMLCLPLAVYRFSDHFKAISEITGRRDRLVKRKKAGFKRRRACTYCGVFRRSMLDTAAKELGADKLAVGHNADDLAQTFLMNLLHRDEGRLRTFAPASDGFGGFVPRIRPLAYNPEEESRIYCRLRGIPFYDCRCPNSSESFRGEVKRFLNGVEEKFPGAKFNVLRAYLDLQGKFDGHEKPAKSKAAACNSCGTPSSGSECMACRLMEELGWKRASAGTRRPAFSPTCRRGSRTR
ncbi:MAG: TIGR00269 family protein [Candidatus Micrarchaeota archaeon]